MKTLFRFLPVLLVIPWSAGEAQQASRKLYVLNSKAETLSERDLTTGAFNADFVTVGVTPNRIHVVGTTIYVVNSTSADITVIDGNTNSFVRNIVLPEGSNPWDMEFVGNDIAYVTGALAKAVYVVNVTTGDILQTIDVGLNPQGILIDSRTVYVANASWGHTAPSVSVIDVETHMVLQTLSVPPNPQELAQALDGTVHVVCTGNYGDVSGSVVVIEPAGRQDQAAIVDTIDIGGAPGDIAITQNGMAYLVDFGDTANGYVYSYDTTTRTLIRGANNPIFVRPGAIGIYYDDRSDGLYVANFDVDTVQLLSSTDGDTLDTYCFGHGPSDMAILDPNPPTSVEGPKGELPEGVALYNNYPNPFNPETSIRFSLTSSSSVRLNVYNLNGRLVRTLVNGEFEAGEFSAVWDSRDDLGKPVASGIYLYQMQAGAVRLAKKLTLLR